MFYFLIITELCLSHKFRINYFVIFPKTFFRCRQVNIPPPKIAYSPHTSNIEIWISIRGQKIVVKEIVTPI